MDDTRVTNHIEQLVAEEHRLLEGHSEGDGLGPEEHARLERVRVELDKYWDLLRQRRARERAGPRSRRRLAARRRTRSSATCSRSARRGARPRAEIRPIG